MSIQIISTQGHKKLNQELDYLTNIKRKEIARRIESAINFGDLSENAEYHEAKDSQAFNEGRIAEIINLLKNVTIIKKINLKNQVNLGSKITVEIDKKKKQYTIVSFNESDPLEGKISNESPLGIAFLNKKIGNQIIVQTPKGNVKYKIVKIE